MKILSVESVITLINRHGFDAYIRDLIDALKRDFLRWEQFTLIPRPAMHVPGGALELMPICDNELYYSYKYVAGAYPDNPKRGKLTVVGTGKLSRIIDGYPVLISEMTILTAMRTAATAALGTDLMSRKDSHVLALIGTGVQSEFQVRGTKLVRDITEVRYFDIDEKAMDKFEKNMQGESFKLTRCRDAEEAVRTADIVTVCTACKAHVDVIKSKWIKEGVHINGLGGDCPGKTELEKSLLPRAKVVIEYFDQAIIEGEIQRFSKKEAKQLVYAEFHELVKGSKKGRANDKEITIFDCIGIALEDYATLRLTYELAEKYNIGEEITVIPDVTNPKDLYSALA